MSSIKGVVIAMDGDDPHSWTSFERGVVVAKLLGVDARLLYMLEGGEALAPNLEKRARERAAELGVRLAVELEVGKNRGILMEEAGNRAWLLVMGTIGASSVVDRIFGSLVDQVIRSTRGAVLVEVHNEQVQPVPWDPELVSGARKPRILVGVDGSIQSALALTMTFGIARAMKAEVTAVSVLRDGESEDDLEDELEMLVELSMETGVSSRFEAVKANTVEEGLNIKMGEGHDLLIISSHGRGKLKERLLGSHARDIIMQARYPVILVRPGGRS